MGLDPLCARDGQDIVCTDGQKPPPEGTPLNGPLSPVGIAATVAEGALAACPVGKGGQAAMGGVLMGKLTKGAGQTFERVVSNVELQATQKTGLLRGGRMGENFFTNSASLDAKRAQQRLGLDGPLRDARIRFRIINDVEVTGSRPAAPGRTGTAGGGREFSTTGTTEIEILRKRQGQALHDILTLFYASRRTGYVTHPHRF